MLKSPVTWTLAVVIGILVHVDWHLGRPGHDHLSFHLPYHWLLGLATFAPLPWVIARRRPASFGLASVVVIGLGVALGQGLEPLGEVLHAGAWEPFTSAARWRVFAEFLAAGIATYLVVAAVVVRRARRSAA